MDAVADAYVDDYCALDPMTATYLGVPGHERPADRPLPRRLRGPRGAHPQAVADATAATAVDEREQVAKEAFLERLGLELEMYDAHVPQSELSVLASGLHEMRSVFDLMDTEGEADWRNIDARLAGVLRRAGRATGATLIQAADAGYVAAQRQITAVAEQIAALDRPGGPGDDFFPELVADADVARASRPTRRGTPREASDAYCGVRPLPRRRARPRAAARRMPSAASATRSARATSSAPSST